MDWNFTFFIEDGHVYRICPSENPEERSPRFHRNPATNTNLEDRAEDLDVERERKVFYASQLNRYKGYERTLSLGNPSMIIAVVVHCDF